MKILYTLNSGMPGGMEQHVLDLVEGMVESNHSVFVWCVQGDMSRRYVEAGAEVTTINIRFELDPIYIFSLIRFLKSSKIDIVHSHELKSSANSLIAGFLARTPVRISHVHTPISEWQMPNKIKELYTKLTIFGYSFLVNMVSSVEIALTESRKEVKRKEGIQSRKLEIIPNGLKTEQFDFSPKVKSENRKYILDKYDLPQDAFIFGNVSRISREKGHEVLVDAFHTLLQMLKTKNQGGNVYLLIAGGGDLESEIRTKAKILGVDDKVRITGVFSDEDHKKLYSSFNSFVFPTLAEGFGIVLIEAMASSLPIVCSDLTVLQEVGGSTVRYFNAGNFEDLAEKMYDIYVRYDQFLSLGKDAQRRVSELFSMDKFISNYKDLYNRLLV